MSKPVDEQASGAVEFTDPPTRQTYDWSAIADRLRQQPMSWGLIFKQDRSSIVNAIRQGSIRILAPRLGVELMTRNNTYVEDGDRKVRVCDLYLRYNPDRDEEA